MASVCRCELVCAIDCGEYGSGELLADSFDDLEQVQESEEKDERAPIGENGLVRAGVCELVRNSIRLGERPDWRLVREEVHVASVRFVCEGAAPPLGVTAHLRKGARAFADTAHRDHHHHHHLDATAEHAHHPGHLHCADLGHQPAPLRIMFQTTPSQLSGGPAFMVQAKRLFL